MENFMTKKNQKFKTAKKKGENQQQGNKKNFLMKQR